MPGLNIIKYFISSTSTDRRKARESLTGALHEADYSEKVFADEPGLFLAATKHPAYPIRTIENRDFLVCLEGAVYNRFQDLLDREMIQVAQTISGWESGSGERLADWLKSADGEFFICIKVKKDGTLYLLNDSLGLLPVYYRQEKTRFILARDIKFISNLINDIRLDRFALAQNLIFNFNLAEKTLFENTRRLPPASLIKIGPDGQVRMTRLVVGNCEEQEPDGRGLAENIDVLVELFDQACASRVRQARGTKIILGLSGGRDSRAVCSGLYRAKADFQGLTFYYRHANSTVGLDVELAREVADRYKVNWQKIPFDSLVGADALKLLDIKYGHNDLSLSFMVAFLRAIQRYADAPATYATGDTGMALRFYLPAKKLRTYKGLIDYILVHNGYLNLKQAARLLRLKPDDIHDDLRADLETFPEKSFDYKYKHFWRHGHEFKWHFDGMDRNRAYTWLMAPLEATLFADYAWKVPDRQKANWRLYNGFLDRLSEKNRGLPLTDYGAPAESFKAGLKNAKDYLVNRISLSPDAKRFIKTRLLKSWDAYQPQALPVRCINEMFVNCTALSEYFDRAEVEKMLGWCSRLQLNHLFSLMAAAEKVFNHCSSLEFHLDEPWSG